MGSKLTIGKRFVLTSGLLLLLTLISAVAAVVGLSTIATDVHSLATDSVPGLYDSSNMRGALTALRGDYLQHIADATPADMAREEASMAKDNAALSAAMASYGGTINHEDDRQNLDRFKADVETVHQNWEAILPLSRADKTVEALALYSSTMLNQIAKARADATTLVKWNKDAADVTLAASTQSSKSALWITILMALATLILGASLSWYMIAALRKQLSQNVNELSVGAGQIASAAAEVRAASQALAEGASQQAASLEETSASSEQINSMAVRNTSNSGAMSQMVSDSQQEFVATNQHLAELVTAMGQINESGANISKIIKVIEEIAFQTNILALNASVEAARAGQAGLGFAVVAEEVRNLSQRCAQAAKDTTDLIEQSIERSGSGKEKVDRMSGSLGKITSDFAKIKLLVDEVSQGSKEQSNGIGQIRRSLTQMEQTTQATAASAEQTASAAEELHAQSDSMHDVVQQLNQMAGTAA
jgi:methyl-accepting chemotaxis protein/methyl-accepting chemotaxis protein-1 (serine sensor receptor)